MMTNQQIVELHEHNEKKIAALEAELLDVKKALLIRLEGYCQWCRCHIDKWHSAGCKYGEIEERVEGRRRYENP